MIGESGFLVEDFLHRLKTEQQYDAEFTSDAMAHLQQEDWPGQIRELEATVKAVVAKIQLGEADAGFVYRSDVTPAVAPKVRTIAIPETFNADAIYPVAIVRQAKNPDLAQEFITLLLSAEGQRIAASHGMLPARSR